MSGGHGHVASSAGEADAGDSGSLSVASKAAAAATSRGGGPEPRPLPGGRSGGTGPAAVARASAATAAAPGRAPSCGSELRSLSVASKAATAAPSCDGGSEPRPLPSTLMLNTSLASGDWRRRSLSARRTRPSSAAEVAAPATPATRKARTLASSTSWDGASDAALLRGLLQGLLWGPSSHSPYVEKVLQISVAFLHDERVLGCSDLLVASE